ncbi:MAG: hypothetical protein CL610_19870 [Anaerolineaceae bacterium]|nr:hypothetical protein [Anaerolineaceae bacterium]
MIACVRLPHFASAVARQQLPIPDWQPLILARYTRRSGKVYAACDEAQRQGVQSGMTLSRARALCPSAQVEPAAESRIQHTLHDLLTRLLPLSSKAEPSPPPYPADAALWLDLGQLPAAETHQMGQRILQALPDYPAAVGLAAGKQIAQIAAQATAVGAIQVVPAGETSAFLAALSLKHLPLHPDLQRRLTLLGLSTFGHLAALPGSAVQLQFGQAGLQLHHLAHGHDPAPVIPYRFEQPICAVQILEDGVADRHLLEAVLCELADQLAAQLSATAQTCQQVCLGLDLADGRYLEAETTPRQPLAQVAALHRSLCRLLDQCPITSAVVRIVAAVRRLAAALPRQLALFAELIPGSQRIEQLAARLSLRHHPDSLLTVTLNEATTSLPEHTFRLEVI